MTGRDGKQYPAARPAAPKDSRASNSPKKKHTSNSTPAVGVEVIDQAGRLADALDATPLADFINHLTEAEKWKLLKQLERCGKTITRHAMAIRRRIG